MTHAIARAVGVAAVAVVFAGCGDNIPDNDPDHGPIADSIMAPLGAPLPSATPEQLATFERGLAVTQRRFSLGDGLGPAFNVTFCGSCHEKPVFGGSAGLYRNFFIAGSKLPNEPFRPQNRVDLFDCGDAEVAPADRDVSPPPESETGALEGVIRQYYYGDNNTARPDPRVDPSSPFTINVTSQRNPIPFFGVGLLAQITEEEILSRSDPNDRNGDGISGRPNYDRGFVGRFGVKAQTTSIEGFIRGPLYNHLGITTDPLSEQQKAALPVDSSLAAMSRMDMGASLWLADKLRHHAQAAAPAGPNCDLDAVADPEMSTDDLFDLVSFAMLLAAPEVEPLTPQGRRGMTAFNLAGCAACHTPRLNSPQGPLPVYSDILLHDMGPDLADGLPFLEATGSEFRTQPLWGVSASGPFLHDGRAHTLDEAIRMHGGEAEQARDRYIAMNDTERADLEEFLMSLGGRSQASPGLVPPNTPAAPPGSYAGPVRTLSPSEERAFIAGRDAFDREFGRSEGVGGPRLNGDSCRACHFEPTIGGAGPRGVNVMRHGIMNSAGDFVPPTSGTVLHKTTSLLTGANFPQPDATVFEHRQTPPLYGLGLIDDLDDAVIVANADPNDEDGDGISGKPGIVDGGRLGRFGWKAQVPSLAEFVRDAVTTELGMTLPAEPGMTFGRIHDNDEVADPEMPPETGADLLSYMKLLGPPPRGPDANSAEATAGEVLFDAVGCAKCHVPTLTGSSGPVALYSDLLLHEILPEGAAGIEDGSANTREFRTPPLWGVSQSGPYLHSGAADTLEEAIFAHEGEASAIREAYEALSPTDRANILAFLETL